MWQTPYITNIKFNFYIFLDNFGVIFIYNLYKKHILF